MTDTNTIREIQRLMDLSRGAPPDAHPLKNEGREDKGNHGTHSAFHAHLLKEDAGESIPAAGERKLASLLGLIDSGDENAARETDGEAAL